MLIFSVLQSHVNKISNPQAITNQHSSECPSHWVPYSFGLVPHRSKELCKLPHLSASSHVMVNELRYQNAASGQRKLKLRKKVKKKKTLHKLYDKLRKKKIAA